MKPDMLASHLEAYIGVREALGFQMRAPRILLREFVQFVNTEGDGGPIRAQLALDWANATSSRRGPSGAAYRLSIARGFLTYLRAAVPETQVPDHHLLAAYRRPKPFLFTVEQLAWLTQAALEEGPSGVMRPHTLAAVIGLMAGTGLRAGEVMRLVVDDVKLDHRPAYSATLVCQTLSLYPSKARR